MTCEEETDVTFEDANPINATFIDAQPINITLATAIIPDIPWGGIVGTLSDQTDLQNALDLKMNLDGTNSNADFIQFDTLATPITNAEGLLQWNTTDGTLDLGMSGGDITMQIGQEMFQKVRNVSPATILNGKAVYASGRTGNRPNIYLARGDAYSTSCVIGVTTQDIASPADGFVTTFGYVRGIKTDYTGSGVWGTTWTAGDKLWLSKTTAGQLTNVEPIAPHHSDVVATVEIVHSNLGSILVNIQKHQTLAELSDVNGTPLATDGQILTWHDTEEYWDADKNINDYKSYSGFENRTDSTISIDGSGVVTLAPTSTSFDVYTKGTGKHVISTSQTVTVTDDQTITYIYVDGSGVLQKSITPWDLTSGVNAPCAIAFKDGSIYTLTDERHSYERNKIWHRWAHFNIGAMYFSGLTGTFNSTTLSITQGVIYDEDISFDTGSTRTACSLWYRNGGTGMRVIRNSTTPYRAVAGALKYDNNSGTLANVDNNKYTTQWVYASNDPTEPIYVVIGQNNDNTVALARNATKPVINLSTAEWKLIYRLIYRNQGGTPTFIEAADFRTVQTGVPSSVGLPTDHASLTGRELANSHPATAISYDNTTSGLTATEVQSAIDEVQGNFSDYYKTDQTVSQTITNGPVDVTGKETTITVDDVSTISTSPTYPTQQETTVSDVSDNSSYIDTAGGSFAYASEQFYIYAYKTAPDLTRVYSATPAAIYLEDQTGSYFQYLLCWQDASAEGYVIYSSYNNYWLDVGNILTYAVSDSSFSGWNYGSPTTTPSSPYYTYSSNGSLTGSQEWYVYGMNSSEVTAVYSANGAYNADSDPYSSGYGWTEQLSWSAASGATSYIVYNYTSGYWIETSELSIIDDGLFSGWTSGAPTVTPTSPQTFYKDLFHGENSVAEFTVDGAGNIISSGSITIDGTVNASNIIPEAPIDGKQYAREDGAWSEVVTPVQAKSLQLSGDFRGMYISSAYWKLIDMESGTSAYPSGVTITRIYVKANVADPTTELNANINYCDAQGTGVFPSTNPTLIRAIDTTTGNYDSGAISVSVATNKIIYLEFDTDPTDFAVTYSLVINYVVN